jgi:hypothetical protein
MGKMIFNVGKSFYILLTDVLPFQEKDYCITARSTGPLAHSASHIIASSTVKESVFMHFLHEIHKMNGEILYICPHVLSPEVLNRF